MIRTTRRNLSVYAAHFGMIPKLFMAYQIWFWVGLVLSIISMAILGFFWKAVYGETSSISGLQLDQTLQYILLAFIFSGARSTWLFCLRAQPSPDDTNLYESLLAVIERRNREVVLVADFLVGSADRTRFAWLVSLVQAPWPVRTDLPREDVATPAGQFAQAAKVTTTDGNVETMRWSHPAVPLGGISRR